jgi:hypothetical protein
MSDRAPEPEVTVTVGAYVRRDRVGIVAILTAKNSRRTVADIIIESASDSAIAYAAALGLGALTRPTGPLL